MPVLDVCHWLKSLKLGNTTKALHRLWQLLLLESGGFIKKKNRRSTIFRTLHLHRSYPKPGEEAYHGFMQIYNLVSILYPSAKIVILYIFKMITLQQFTYVIY